jgi:uncharacterized protein YdcH (DUF465 family)
MFEFDQSIVQELLQENEDFQHLYKRHHELKEKVHKAELGILPLDDFTLGSMKKQKLAAKDRMAVMISDYRREHPNV